MKVTYQSTAEARATAGNIPVFCAFDKLIDPKDLVGNPRNPNQHPADQIHLLAHIIQSQGWCAPITVSNQSGFVVRGHGRLAAALEFGAECVPVDYQNYSSEAEEWADLIADNRLAELSEIDNTKIADLIAEMDTGEVPVILSGYTEDEIVSSDIIGMRYGSLFDATQTMVSPLPDGKTQVEVVSWYDNENSYVSQMVRTIKYFAELA